MDEQALTLRELLDQTGAAASLGDREDADATTGATERSPATTKRGWPGHPSRWMKKRAYEHVLAINPNNGEARIALQRLAKQVDGQQALAIQETLNRPVAQDVPKPASSAASQHRSATTTSTRRWTRAR